MKILIVEDDELKHQYLDKFFRDTLIKCELVWKKSFQSGLADLIDHSYDLIVLDMSMHIYEKTAEESGGSFETYAGRMILSEIDINEIDTKVVVVTGYDVYGDGKTLGKLKQELREEFGDFYLDTIYFIGKEDRWKRELTQLIEKYFGKNFRKPAAGINLSVIIIEDDELKLKKVIDTISAFSPDINVKYCRDQIAGQQLLLVEKFDLMILDMQLPVRIETGKLENDGGLKILEDLQVDDNYKLPTCILALTEYDDLQMSVRESFEDIAAIKFDPTSTRWSDAIHRTLLRLVKTKVDNRVIVYCEGENAALLNKVGLPGYGFRGLADCRAIYLAAKNEKEVLAIRDRDFLTTSEVGKLRQNHKNLLILDYYCFENYLFHPDNILEVKADFDHSEYIADLRRQKRAKLMAIVQDYKISRNGYTDLTDNGKAIMDKNPENEIITSLESDDFEHFYRYFDMAGKKDTLHKKSYSKEFLNKYNIKKEELAMTSWFRGQILALLRLGELS